MNLLAPRTAVQRLKDLLATGEFSRGARLPSERLLAARLGVSRPSLREALSVLETLGVLRSGAGRGTFVADGEISTGGDTWRFAGRYSLQEVYQFRFVVEGYAAGLAAIKITDEEIAALRVVINNHKEAIRSVDLTSAADHDFAFHRLIMRYSGNGVFLELMTSYRQMLLESQLLPERRKDRLWEPIGEHENILQTLARHDSDGAKYFMHLHISRAADRGCVALTDTL